MNKRMWLPAVALAVLASGCMLAPKWRAGAAVSGVFSLSSSLDPENPYMLDAFVRMDLMLVQVEASLGQKTYTFDYEDGAVMETGELEVVPLALTARVALGNPRKGGIRKLWLLGAGVVYSQVSQDDFDTLDYENYDTYRFSLGHEWDVGKLLILVEAAYQASRDIVASDPILGAVELNTTGAMTRIAVGYRF